MPDRCTYCLFYELRWLATRNITKNGEARVVCLITHGDQRLDVGFVLKTQLRNSVPEALHFGQFLPPMAVHLSHLKVGSLPWKHGLLFEKLPWDGKMAEMETFTSCECLSRPLDTRGCGFHYYVTMLDLIILTCEVCWSARCSPEENHQLVIVYHFWSQTLTVSCGYLLGTKQEKGWGTLGEHQLWLASFKSNTQTSKKDICKLQLRELKYQCNQCHI